MQGFYICNFHEAPFLHFVQFGVLAEAVHDGGERDLQSKFSASHSHPSGRSAALSEVDPRVRTTGSGFLVGSAAVPTS